MDESTDKRTLNSADFNVGDLVKITSNQILIEEVGFGGEQKYIYGIVVQDPRRKSKINAFMPQIAIYMLNSHNIEFHWPSYLTLVSSIYKKG